MTEKLREDIEIIIARRLYGVIAPGDPRWHLTRYQLDMVEDLAIEICHKITESR